MASDSITLQEGSISNHELGTQQLTPPPKRQPHICIFMQTFGGGGAEFSMVTLANGLLEQGVRVDMIVASAEGPNLSRLDPGVRLIDFRKANVASCIMPLARYLRRARPDGLLSAMTHSNNAAIIARGLSRVATRIVISERITLRWQPTSIREALHIRLRKLLYRFADALVMVAREEVADAVEEFALDPSSVKCIYNPVLSPEFEQARKERPEHPWLQPSRDRSVPVVVAVGRLNPIKDYPTLLRAFARVRESREARLVIIGAGDQKDELEALIGELGIGGSVSLAGYLQNPIKEMNAADLFALTSRLEGLPGVLIQALGCGLPIVSTDSRTGPREVLDGGRLGSLVPVGDVSAVAEAMLAKLDEGPRSLAVQDLERFSLHGAVMAYRELLLPLN